MDYTKLKNILYPILDVANFFGSWAPLLAILVIGVAFVFFCPATFITTACGFLFYFGSGFFTFYAGAFLSLLFTWGICQSFLRTRLVKRYGSHPKFQAIDRLTGHEGVKTLALLRFLIPFPIGNFLYACTSMSFRSYLLVGMIPVIPGALVTTYLGHLLRVGADAAISGQVDRWRMPLQLLVFAAFAAGLFLLARQVRAALRRAEVEA